MVLVSEKLNPQACWEFEADIYLLFHAKHITIGFQATVHCDNICQTAQISYMNKVRDFKYIQSSPANPEPL
jgi:GTPase